MPLRKIVSGGQTGADRGALDAAIALGIPHGGWCPRGRRAEDGTIPSRYRLTEVDDSGYVTRTERNVRDADATVVFTRGHMTPGSDLTVMFAALHGKPLLHLNIGRMTEAQAASRLGEWLDHGNVTVLNVAGSRESKAPGIQSLVRHVISLALAKPGGGRGNTLSCLRS